MAETTAELSTWKMMWCPFQRWPHLRMAWSTAYTSLNWMSWALNQRGHLDEYHWSPNIPQRPLEPMASVKMFKVSRGASKIWTPFHDDTYVDHQRKSDHTDAGTCLHAK